MIPCAHGKLNVTHYQTTPKPAIHTSITAEKDEAALARKEYRAPKHTQTAQQQQQCEYIHTCVCKRGRFPQTRDLWRKSVSMGYREGRVSLHAVSRWSRSSGCCGYISWCVFLVSGEISFLFRVFFFFERTRPTASTRQPCLMYLSTSNEARPRERSDRGHFLP